MEGNVPLIESIISHVGNTLKLRFLDGSVGELNLLEAFGYEGEVKLEYRVLWGESGQPICEAESAYMNATFPKREWPLSPEQSEAAARWLKNPTPMRFP